MKRVYILELDDGEVLEYLFNEEGSCIKVIGDCPTLEQEDVRLIDNCLSIYEGCHWERGDRDETVPIPGVTQDASYLVSSDYNLITTIREIVLERNTFLEKYQQEKTEKNELKESIINSFKLKTE